MREIYLIYSTFPNPDEAKGVAKKLIEERLCACVNIVPKIDSIYWWEGKIEEEGESLLIAKTVEEKVEKITRRIKELHPYDLPAILVLKVEGGLVEFLEYVGRETEG